MQSLGPDFVTLWHPDMLPSARKYRATALVETEAERLSFYDASAEIILAIARCANGVRDLREVATACACSEEAIFAHLKFLQDEGIVLNLADYRSDWPPDLALQKLRSAARFYNRRVAANPCLRTIFSGQAGRELLVGYAIEFYFYVSSVTRYMAHGIARFEHGAAIMAPYWRHFSEEAKHAEIFKKGLSAFGVVAERLQPNCAIATTHALTNFLFERASRTLLEYGSLFAIMQPAKGIADDSATSNYGFLRKCYPYATDILDAFELHDKIDAEAGHETWALEQELRTREIISADEMSRAYTTIRDAACFFIMFFDGIKETYQSGCLSAWKPSANVAVDVEFARSSR
jgi:pyrroloquinoline quinone (PQQ) biosynthesis protein C